ncbi:MAG: carboxypeptidase regulatory-like domain-containing protein [Candidatus Sulfotelmatobacter sp.]
MRKRFNPAVVLSLIVLVGCAALILGQKVNAAGEGKITGTVKLSGTAPHMRGIDMSKDPYCVKANPTPAHYQNVEVGSGEGLENVVLYISDWSGTAEVTTAIPVFDQKNCMYVPHVLAMDVGETFKVVTSDQTAHNIHPLPNPMINVGWNQSQPPGAPPVEKSWKNAEFIPVQCNIHPWMHGYFAVVKGPYATTDANGSFTINNVPPGTYTVTAWHEPDPVLPQNTQGQKVTVAAGGSATADFTFKTK